MKNLLVKKLIIIFISIFTFYSTFIPRVLAQNQSDETNKELILDTIKGIIDWKKGTLGIQSDKPLLNNEFLQNAGDTTGDWYPIGIGRSGYPDDYESYLAVIKDVVEKRYQEKDLLSETKATEWHRISLAILAMGGDPTNIGQDKNGKPINLIADGTYNRGLRNSLGMQGLNGWIWGLITLDSMRYATPKDAYYTRENIILEILKNQLADGGFSISGDESDPDMTAMAIQALSPYYNSEEIYKYTQRATNKKIEKTVREVIDEALLALSKMQLDTGEFESWGIANVESTAQVIVALTSLGINPIEDKRFIKNGNNLLDVLLKYVMDDGGFIHSEIYDLDNPTALPDESNSMASEQVLYALVAIYRNLENYRTLYDFRKEMSKELKQKIQNLQESIERLPKKLKESDRKIVEKLFNTYLTIPIEERSYVFNYYKLSDAMKSLKIKNTSEPYASNIGVNENGKGTIISFFEHSNTEETKDVFSEDDVKIAKAIPDNTTEKYVEVVKLLSRLEKASNKNQYEEIYKELVAKKQKIEEIEKEIASINQLILEKLYPINEIRIKDKEIVEQVLTRIEVLSSYDQQKVQGLEDVKRAETKINNKIRTIYISIGLVGIIIVLSMILIIRRRKRKIAKQQEMMLDDFWKGEQ